MSDFCRECDRLPGRNIGTLAPVDLQFNHRLYGYKMNLLSLIGKSLAHYQIAGLIGKGDM
jgi:hypothetical protein